MSLYTAFIRQEHKRGNNRSYKWLKFILSFKLHHSFLQFGKSSQCIMSWDNRSLGEASSYNRFIFYPVIYPAVIQRTNDTCERVYELMRNACERTLTCFIPMQPTLKPCRELFIDSNNFFSLLLNLNVLFNKQLIRFV